MRISFRGPFQEDFVSSRAASRPKDWWLDLDQTSSIASPRHDVFTILMADHPLKSMASDPSRQYFRSRFL